MLKHMKTSNTLLMLAILIFQLMGAAPVFSKRQMMVSHAASVDSLSGVYLGTLGKGIEAGLSIHNIKSGETTLNGTYYYSKHHKGILLKGTLSPENKFQLKEYPTPDLQSTGTFYGKLENRHVSGSWISVDEKQQLPFEFKKVDPGAFARISRKTLMRDLDRTVVSIRDGKLHDALFFLKLYASEGGNFVSDWEYALNAEISGNAAQARLVLEEKCKNQPSLSCDALAYLESKSGMLAQAEKRSAEYCNKWKTSRPFACMMHATLLDTQGKTTEAIPIYKTACFESELACIKAWGKNEVELIDAIQERRLKDAEQILKKPVNVNAFDEDILYQATIYSNKEIVELLLKKGAHPNRSTPGHSPLAGALVRKAVDIVNLLLDYGALPNEPAHGRGYVQLAVWTGNVPLLKRMIKMGANVNANDYVGSGTALISAIEDNRADIVQILLESGADPLESAKFHGTPEEIAREKENPEIINLIAGSIKSQKKANPNDSH
jgi:hypothetical protein